MTNDDFSPAEHDEPPTELEPYAPGKVWSARSQDSDSPDEAAADGGAADLTSGAEITDEAAAADHASDAEATNEAAAAELGAELNTELSTEAQPVVIDDVDDSDIEDIVGSLPAGDASDIVGDVPSDATPSSAIPSSLVPADDASGDHASGNDVVERPAETPQMPLETPQDAVFEAAPATPLVASPEMELNESTIPDDEGQAWAAGDDNAELEVASQFVEPEPVSADEQPELESYLAPAKHMANDSVVPSEVAPEEAVPSEVVPVEEVAPVEVAPVEVAPEVLAPAAAAAEEVTAEEVVPSEIAPSEAAPSEIAPEHVAPQAAALEEAALEEAFLAEAVLAETALAQTALAEVAPAGLTQGEGPQAAVAFDEPATPEAPVAGEDEEAPLHTTTIPVASAEDIANYQPSATMPNDVLEARDMDNPPTSAIRRDLMAPHEHREQAPAWEAALAASSATAASSTGIAHPQPTGDTPESLSDAIFDGATVVPVVPSRTGTHIMSLFLGLILIPAAWFLFADASARMLFPADAPVITGQPSWVALGEFGASIVLWLIFVLVTLRSSLGAWVWGVIVTIKGLPWLIAPGLTIAYLQPILDWISSHGGVIGRNLAHHVQLEGFSGRFLMTGLTLLALAFVAVRVRQRGRAEEALRARVEKVNPEGAYLTARERRRARKESRSA